MDKETLSNYGWVVIVIIVLVLLIGTASPFGNFIADGAMSALNSFKEASTFDLFDSDDSSDGKGETGSGDSSGNQGETGSGDSSTNEPEVITNYTADDIDNVRYFAIGAAPNTLQVVAAFNDDFTEVTITKNGENSEGLMMDWGDAGNIMISPMAEKNTILKKAFVKEGVVSIGNLAFLGVDLETETPVSSLTSIELPNSLRYIKFAAFNNCTSLTNIVIPDGVIKIEERAFFHCSNLTSIVLPNSVTSIDCYVFYNCENLTNVTFGDNVTMIGEGAFEDCVKLTNITIPYGVLSIGKFAFNNCDSLTNITIPDSVTLIDNSAFAYCSSLTNIIVPNNAILIDKYAFGYSAYYGDTNNWENDVFYIGNHLIEGKKTMADDYKVKDGTIDITNYAFYYCDNLTEVTIPDSVTSIGDNAFNSNNLKTVYGETGSFAETWANSKSYTFVAI